MHLPFICGWIPAAARAAGIYGGCEQKDGNKQSELNVENYREQGTEQYGGREKVDGKPSRLGAWSSCHHCH